MEVKQFQYTLIQYGLNIMSNQILYLDCLFVREVKEVALGISFKRKNNFKSYIFQVELLSCYSLKSYTILRVECKKLQCCKYKTQNKLKTLTFGRSKVPGSITTTMYRDVGILRYIVFESTGE